jgi:hypothetical protein
MDKNIEIALSYGRKKQNPNTGFVHFSYESPHEDKAVTIPVVKNMLFALALLRSRNGDNIHEAKEIIQKLLHFQTPSGNFPVYLHEYPECKYRWLPIELLPPCYWIITEFHAVLGETLLSDLKKATENLLEYSIKEYSHSPIGPLASIKLSQAAIALGHKEFGEKILQKPYSLFIAQDLGEILAAYQMTHPLDIYEHLQNVWHNTTQTYTGPSVKEYYTNGKPNLSLYNFYMAALTNKYPAHLFQEHPCQLKAALIRPIDYEFQPHSYPFTISKDNWIIHQDQDYSYSLTEKNDFEKTPYHKAFLPLKIVWEQLHSLVCHTNAIVKYQAQDNNIEIIFSLPPETDEREISLYTNSKTIIPQATVFYLGDTITIPTEKFVLTLTFEKVSGEGRFCGHIMNGSRSAELIKDRFQAHDKQIFLRTLQRDAACQIKLKVEIKPC